MMDIYPLQDIVFVCAFIVIWALGFKAGMAR